jgi:hypothetical protein
MILDGHRGIAMFRSLFLRLFVQTASLLDRRFGWDRLPVPLGIAVLIGLRANLRRRNLFDTGLVASTKPLPEAQRYLTARTADGRFNDLESPAMGSVNTRFGRNFPPKYTHREDEQDILNRPNPRKVSRELLTRDAFKPARSLNLLAAAWLQFMIRDWFSHGEGDKSCPPWKLEVSEDDLWPQGHKKLNSMEIPRTAKDTTRSPGDPSPPTYVNTQTHWWDGSQIYGSNDDTQDRLRSKQDGKLKVGLRHMSKMRRDGKKQHPLDEPGFWVGLAMIGELFQREHNAICDLLRGEYPHWSDDALFQHARLINTALMAKIQMTEWTPTILAHPTLRVAMKATWWGLAGKNIKKLAGRIIKNEVITGIVGGRTDHFGVPYSITEEFAAVYRMHSLLPDDYTFRSALNDMELQKRKFAGVAQQNVTELMQQVPIRDLFYSFGVANSGELTLHNYPRGLQSFRRPDDEFMDLAATDILRSRELGVPRYNQFRELLHLPRIESFEDLTENRRWAEELSRVYENDIDQMDLMVGLLAEPKPKKFGFGDTTFRIFLVMTSRRLNSDRLFTTDYTPEVYTQVGLDYIDDNNLSKILVRHFPGLQPSLRGLKSAFAPWRRVGL